VVIILGDSSNSNKILSALLLNVIVVNVSFLNSDKTFMSSELFCLGCSLQKKPNTHTQTKQNKTSLTPQIEMKKKQQHRTKNNQKNPTKTPTNLNL